MAIDVTNAGEPQAGGLLSGEATKRAAIKRLAKAPQSSGPNTGPSGAPKPGGGLQQRPGVQSYSSTPFKKKGV
jgi:hypothetical protein